MNNPAPIRKKLIEVALPLEAINEEGSRRKRKAPAGYPTALHKWWAQRPIAAARAVIFAQLVDDPSSWPDLFPTEKKQEKERQRLFDIIEELILWENSSNDIVLERATDEIWRSWRRACAENVDHPRAKELFDREKLPSFCDPFAGGGSIPLEAQRLGLDTYASDLNPVAVLINKAMVEIPPRFAGTTPVNPESRLKMDLGSWSGTRGLAEDVRYYSRRIREEAEILIGHLYPKIEVTPEMAIQRPDLKSLVGKSLTVVAWMWARTVKSPNPAFRNVDVPLASTFILANKPGREAYVEPVLDEGQYHFTVKVGAPANSDQVKRGTSAGKRGAFSCLMSSTPITYDYIRDEGRSGRLGSRLMAVVVESEIGRLYLSPTPEQEAAAKEAQPEWAPDVQLQGKTRVNVSNYGLDTFSDLFTGRQLLSLTTFADLIAGMRDRIEGDARSSGAHEDPKPLSEGGSGSKAYAEAVSVYLAFAFSRLVHHSSAVCTWLPKDSAIRQTFSKQAIPMTWDFTEGNVFGKSSAEWLQCVKVVAAALEALPARGVGFANALDAGAVGKGPPAQRIISTDPPYYDNVSYADLSDYFYVWLRRCLRQIYPDLFATVATPKDAELVASALRHGGARAAEGFFLDGMTRALQCLADQAHPAFPVTIYYAFKQSESEDDQGTASTGWETFLEAVFRSGFMINGTWPMRTEGDNRQLSIGANALASSIVLVCRLRDAKAQSATRREFLTVLQRELPAAIADLQRGNVAPVDLQQAAIGPGIAVFTRYSQVLDANGKSLSVRDALIMVNQALDEALAKQEGDFDSDTRWALTWFEQYGFAEGEYGVAETLATARNTSVNGIVEAGIGVSGRGKVRLLKPEELPADWTPEGDKRLTVWDMVHHMIRILDQGETPAGELLARLGAKAEVARELAYRLYSICDRTKRSQDAQRYNALVQSWPEIALIAQQIPKQAQEKQQSFDGMN